MISYQPPADPPNEAARQRAVDASGARRLRGDDRLQQIVEHAARLFATPMAVISIIDRQRQWFAARHGTDLEETPRAIAFCAHAIHRPGEALVVPDAQLDQRFAGHPLVQSDPHVRFYAGMPLVDRGGYALGALCVADLKPRRGVANIFELTLLAREAEHLLAR